MKRFFAITLLCVGAAFAACSDGDDGAPAVGPAEDAGRDVRGEAQSWDPPDAEPDAGPVYNQDGWVRVDFDPGCAFFAAPSADKMPPPIQWEPCDAGLNPLGWMCRQTVFDWPKSTKLSEMGGAPKRAWVSPNGTVFLMISRFSGSYLFDLVAEADGPVHTAVSVPYGRCYVTDGSVSAGRVAFNTVNQPSASQVDRWGAIGGSIDEIPRVLETDTSGAGHDYEVGANAYFVYPDNRLNDWTPATNELARLGITDPGQVGGQRFIGDTLFFDVGNGAYGRIKTFSLDAGLKDLVSFGNDVSKNAEDFGTDGIDMVWTEGTGRTSGGPTPFDDVAIMTAKFTTDEAVVAATKRRVRSEPGTIGERWFQVGCGYATHEYISKEFGRGIRLLRLSDGVSWRFDYFAAPDGGMPWVYVRPLAVTCDEVFLSVQRNAQFNVARIRIDSLGPGEPAD